jgi:hypothetical protein
VPDWVTFVVAPIGMWSSYEWGRYRNACVAQYGEIVLGSGCVVIKRYYKMGSGKNHPFLLLPLPLCLPF